MESDERHRENLAHYRSELAAAWQRLDAAKAEVVQLSEIVFGIEQGLGISALDPDRLDFAPTVTDALRAVMADGRPRSIADVDAALHERNFKPRPSRSSITNRLVDLVQQGYLERVKRGRYQLASAAAEAKENGDRAPGPNRRPISAP